MKPKTPADLYKAMLPKPKQPMAPKPKPDNFADLVTRLKDKTGRK